VPFDISTFKFYDNGLVRLVQRLHPKKFNGHLYFMHYSTIDGSWEAKYCREPTEQERSEEAPLDGRQAVGGDVAEAAATLMLCATCLAAVMSPTHCWWESRQ
jgi:hypothetical protein